jgi:hypothetical protein
MPSPHSSTQLEWKLFAIMKTQHASGSLVYESICTKEGRTPARIRLLENYKTRRDESIDDELREALDLRTASVRIRENGFLSMRDIAFRAEIMDLRL